MKKTSITIFIFILGITGSKAQTTNGKKNIEKLCGCFEVEFKYAETFSPDTAYKYHERKEISNALELALPIEINDKKTSIQHLLLADDNTIVKHWREDWVYEPKTIWKFRGNSNWTKDSLTAGSAKEKWMQSVWEVSDAPRYQGVSEWINTDGKTYWQNTTDAPLPRREYTTRSDYNILRRTNRIVLTETGWIHEQDNKKVIRKEGMDKLLVEEKGLNTYKRIEDKHCEAAKLWWEKNGEYWSKIRAAWQEYTNTHSSITLKEAVDGKALHQYLGEIAKKFASRKIKTSEIDVIIKAAIEKYMDNAGGLAQSNKVSID